MELYIPLFFWGVLSGEDLTTKLVNSRISFFFLGLVKDVLGLVKDVPSSLPMAADLLFGVGFWGWRAAAQARHHGPPQPCVSDVNVHKRLTLCHFLNDVLGSRQRTVSTTLFLAYHVAGQVSLYQIVSEDPLLISVPESTIQGQSQCGSSSGCAFALFKWFQQRSICCVPAREEITT